jgi:hypothetical protein
MKVDFSRDVQFGCMYVCSRYEISLIHYRCSECNYICTLVRTHTCCCNKDHTQCTHSIRGVTVTLQVHGCGCHEREPSIRVRELENSLCLKNLRSDIWNPTVRVSYKYCAPARSTLDDCRMCAHRLRLANETVDYFTFSV